MSAAGAWAGRCHQDPPGPARPCSLGRGALWKAPPGRRVGPSAVCSAAGMALVPHRRPGEPTGVGPTCSISKVSRPRRALALPMVLFRRHGPIGCRTRLLGSSDVATRATTFALLLAGTIAASWPVQLRPAHTARTAFPNVFRLAPSSAGRGFKALQRRNAGRLTVPAAQGYGCRHTRSA